MNSKVDLVIFTIQMLSTIHIKCIIESTTEERKFRINIHVKRRNLQTKT